MSYLEARRGGIYEIVNTASGKRYIGSAVCLRRRLAGHRRELLAGRHKNRHMQSAWNKYGSAVFEFRPLLICSSSNLLVYEQRAIDAYQPAYNICPTAGSTFGHKLTHETKKKISAAMVGNTYVKGRKWKVPNRRAAQRTRAPISEETRAKIRAGWTRRRARGTTDEARANMRAAAMGNTNGLGHVASVETRRKLSAARMGNTNGKGGKGIPKSAEHNAKNSAAQIKRNALKRAARDRGVEDVV